MTVAQQTRTLPPRTALPGSPSALVAQARSVLTDAASADSAAERFRLAHLGALRTAAAVFAERGRPAASRRRLVGVWAGFFAAAAPARAAVEAGAVSAVSERDADDQLRAAVEFLYLVESSLGMLSAPMAS